MAVPEQDSAEHVEGKKKFNFKNLVKFILGMRMEAVFLFYALPGYLCVIALATLPLEKACRINLAKSDEICSNLNNLTIKVACGDIYAFAATEHEDHNASLKVVMDKIGTDFNFTQHDLEVVEGVCFAETESQKLQIAINKLRAPIGFLGLLVIVYAGPLGDRYGRKKPYLLLPMAGELIAVCAYLTTSILKSQVPMGFHMYLERFMYALSGSLTLMLMGVFSFLAAETTEKDRTFRFGIFTVFLSGLGIVAQAFSDVIFEALGYVNLFLFCAFVHVCGIVFIIFFVEEIKAPPALDTKLEVDGAENPGFDASTLELRDRGAVESSTPAVAALPPVAETGLKAVIKDGFQLCISNFTIFKVERPNFGRSILIFTLLTYVIIVFLSGEQELRIPFGRKAWNWVTEFSNYYSYISIMVFVGNTVVTGLFINFLKLPDSSLAIIAFFTSIIARAILPFTKSDKLIYTAATIDMFQSTPVIAIRSLLSKVVKPEELGRAYSVMGITDVAVAPVALLVYNSLYEETIDTVPGSFYLMSIAFYIVLILLFVYIKMMFNRFVKAGGQADPETSVANNNDKVNGNEAEVSRF